jgi:hypothetical protein
MDNEGIHYRPNGELSALVGRDATQLMRVNTILRGIDMYIATGGKMILTRGATITKLLAMATEYTGQKYKRTEAKRARDDLNVWFYTMKSALPTYTDGQNVSE